MDGAAEREKKELDRAFWQAWHVEAFARMEGEAFKNALKRYLARDEKTSGSIENAKGIAFFQRLKARGVPIEITRH